MGYKQLTILFMIVFCMGLVIAPPAVKDQFLSDYGLTVQAPSELYIKQNSDYKYHFHVINVTDGLPLTNMSGVGCTFHLYNHTGSHIHKEFTSVLRDGFDFEIVIAGGNYSKKGQYSYIVTCNNSYAGGTANSYFYVTGNGEENLEGIAKLLLYLFFMIVFVGLILSFVVQITKLALTDVTVYDVMISLCFYVLLVFSYFMAKNYLLTTMTEDLMGWSITVGSFTNVILPLIAFIISFIKKSFDKGRVISIEELNGGFRR